MMNKSLNWKTDSKEKCTTKFNLLAIGSAPGDRTKMSGIVEFESK